MTPDQAETLEQALEPCPFCGSQEVDPEGWASHNPETGVNRTGPACDECGGSADSIELWNRRATPPALTAHRAAYPLREGEAPILDLPTLRKANRIRQDEWTGNQDVDLVWRANELAGEVGEACNEVKKLARERRGWPGSRSTVAKLAEEIADVVICADLLAMSEGINLSVAVIEKFNATSLKVGMTTLLAAPPPPPEVSEEVVEKIARIIDPLAYKDFPVGGDEPDYDWWDREFALSKARQIAALTSGRGET